MGSLLNENILDIKTTYLNDDEDMFSEASDCLLKNMAQLEGVENLWRNTCLYEQSLEQHCKAINSLEKWKIK